MLSSSADFQPLLAQFQARYPRGSLIAELLTIHQNHYVVRAIVQLEGVALTTGMAAAPDIEAAEDRAKYRALEALGLLSPASSRVSSPSLPVASSSRFSSGVTSFSLPEQPVGSPGIAELPELTAPVSLPDPVREMPLETATSLPPLPATRPPLAEQPLAEKAELEDAKGGFDRSSFSPEFETTLDTTPPVQSVESLYPSYADSAPEPASQASTTLNATRSNQKSAKRKAEAASTSPTAPTLPTPADRSEEIAKIGFEMKRLGWSTEQGREYLKRTYGKRSRQELNDEELLDFLQYLEAQPASLQAPF